MIGYTPTTVQYIPVNTMTVDNQMTPGYADSFRANLHTTTETAQ